MKLVFGPIKRCRPRAGPRTAVFLQKCTESLGRVIGLSGLKGGVGCHSGWSISWNGGVGDQAIVVYNLTHKSQDINSRPGSLQTLCEPDRSLKQARNSGEQRGQRGRERPGHQAANHNHFPLDLRRPKGDTPPTQMLYPEMDSWVGAAPLESRKTRLTVACLILFPSAASLNRSRTVAECRVAGTRRAAGSAGSHDPLG